MFKEYGKLSSLMYELTKPVGSSLNGDLEYYLEKLQAVNGPILEAGVGTGRLLIPFLQKGLEMEGLDLSKEMLAYCQKNLNKAGLTASIWQADLTNWSTEKQYAAIIMPTGSFGLLPNKKLESVLANFYRQLQPAGKLIIDLELPVGYDKNQLGLREIPIDETSGILFTGTPIQIDWYQQKASYLHRYELVKNGTVLKTELSHFELAWYGLREFTLHLEKANFKNIRYELNYNKQDTGSLVTFLAEK
ncbi:class I SAM-dependent methyltransferase [Enterococcus sp. HY326]|uniref:class I SAM-dependent methyltransferase n=1 Tax=Enterococcus sp. HY326 TaxID=2971265 RepID=UPI00223FD372|nr:class I SAM-dependent methyltransferase [Enterococcus sp. HY326]